MDAGLIAARYARALLLFAEEQQAAEHVYQDAEALQKALQGREGLPRCIEALSKPMQRFITLVIRNKRTTYLPAILRSYRTLYRKEHGITQARLRTVAECPELEEKLRQLLKADGYTKVDFESEVDPALVGGFVLQIDDLRLDASVASQLRLVRKEIEAKIRKIS